MYGYVIRIPGRLISYILLGLAQYLNEDTKNE